ncbi:MAG TPA: hypothetical protein VFK05_12020 [Polyangiaceae bacterium]|nr:hypothetical protein [Polyangiaceae bacterium]
MSPARCSHFALLLGLASLVLGCQKTEEHPPYEAACVKNCAVLPGISLSPGTGNAAGGGGGTPDSDAGTGSLQGHVLLLTDDSFVRAMPYTGEATVTADGATGTPVSGTWNGSDPTALFSLEGIATLATSWVSIKPTLVGGDALPTYEAVQTNRVSNVDLKLVAASTLDGIFSSVSTLRSPDSGQVVLFFQSAGTGAALSGLHVTMPTSQAGIYAVDRGWVLDDGTALTNQSGLVVFGNVEPANSNGTQTVSVARAATATTPATPAGQFTVKVVQGAVTIATVNVQL